MKPSNYLFSFWSGVGFISLSAVMVGLVVWFFLDQNHRAIYYMKLKKYEKAQSLLSSVLGEDTFSPLYRMNLAFSYLLSGEYEKSIQEYQTVRRLIQLGYISYVSSIDPLDFYVAFNSATSAVGKKQTERALAFYQQALKEEGGHPLRVKTNIELLTRQMAQNRKQKNESKKNKSQKNQTKAQSETSKAQSKTPKDVNDHSSSKKSELQKSDLSQWSERQISEILKSIQDQEVRIKQRRNRDRRRSSPTSKQGKDW